MRRDDTVMIGNSVVKSCAHAGFSKASRAAPSLRLLRTAGCAIPFADFKGRAPKFG
jgi:hypothetical protein